MGVGSAVLVAGVGRAGATPEQVTPTMIVPAVDEFEDNYAGQFLTVLGRDSEEGDPQDVHDACDEIPWPDGETEVNQGQLTDRRSDEPIAVRLPVFVDGRRTPIREDTLFVISDASPCGGAYVTIQTSSVNLRSVAGEPPGPNVTETENDGTGFGIASALVAGGTLLARSLLDRE